MTSNYSIQTSPEKTRIVTIDALRGFALAGVALVHFVEQYLAGPGPEGYMEGINSLPDHIVQGFLQIFFTGKFFALFSILFGLSFFIQMDAAARKGEDFGGRFLWRAALLFIIGYVHQLFYRGDILTIYAVLAPLLVPFYRVPSKWILILAGLIFLGIPRFIAFSILGDQGISGYPMTDPQHPMAITYFDTVKNGSLWEIFSLNATYGMLTKIDFQLSLFGRFYYTFGYFLIGLWLGKSGLFKGLSAFTRQIKDVAIWSFIGFVLSMVAMIITFANNPQPQETSSWLFALGMNFFDWTSIFMTAMILCGFLMLCQKDRWKNRLFFFAPYGRMALTNYVLQSIIGTFIYFGWGLGLIGEVRALYAFGLGILVIVAQALLSKYWLQYFKFGPLEWIWRCGTYLKWQPLVKVKAETVMA